MKLLILGATGPTGRHVMARALKRGDSVTALARRPEALDDVADRITIVKGDATSTADVVKALDGQDAVISALGRGTSLRADDLFSQAADALTTASRDTGVTRLVWLSSFGVGDTIKDATLMQKLLYRTLLRNIYANKVIAEKILRNSPMEWTIVYPTTLSNTPTTGTYQVDDHITMKGVPKISRADVAEFMHKAAHDPTWIHRNAVITT